MGTVKDVGDVVTDLVRGRKKESSVTVEGSEEKNKKFTFSKALVWILIYEIFHVGLYFLFRSNFKALGQYIEYIRAFGVVFGPLIIMVGVGRAFKHSIFSKDR